MARVIVTPPINAEGFYEVNSPYTVDASIVYRCHAIRTFAELATRGVNVFEQYYKPLELPESTYDEDLRAGASIVVLISSDNIYTYIPNTYVRSYPGMNGIQYDHKVIVMELGMLPTTSKIDYVLDELSGVITRAVGVTSKPTIATVPYRGNVTHEQHLDLERRRRAAISNNVTLVSQLKTVTDQNVELNKTIAEMTAVIKALQSVK